MKKGDFLITKNSDMVYQIAGRWGMEMVLASIKEDDEQVLIYTESELRTLISEGHFRKLYEVGRREGK